MSQFKPLNTKKYHKTKALVTSDTLYWKRLGSPTLVKEYGAIDYINFSPLRPFTFAVTCSVRVQIYNPITKLVVSNLSRFQECAHGGSFRKDGRLLVAGDDEGLVKIFDPSSKNILRLLKGHKAPVHRTFFTSDMLHIASFSDDKTVKLWDITMEKGLHTFEEHDDYIRAGAVSPVSADVIVSGAYDGKIKMYDTRAPTVLHTIDHGAPVESLIFLPTGGIFISAGGTELRVWDAFAGCRLLTKLSQHHKTITCLHLASDGKRILSGGLDRHVKIYDVANYQTVHTLDYSSPVLSVGVSPYDQTVVAGMVDGLVSVQNMENKRGEDSKPEAVRRRKNHRLFSAIQADHKVETTARPKESHYNTHLRRYEYVKALDAVMLRYITNKTPEVTVSVMQELIHRKGLHRALAGRTHASLVRIIVFIRRYIGEYRFQRALIDVAQTLLDVYENSFHEFTDDLGKQFLLLANALQREVALTHEMLELQGAIELLLDASNVDESDEVVHFINDEKTTLIQSEKAKECSVMRIY